MKKTRIYLPRNSFDHDWYLTIFAFSFFHSFLKMLTLAAFAGEEDGECVRQTQ